MVVLVLVWSRHHRSNKKGPFFFPAFAMAALMGTTLAGAKLLAPSSSSATEVTLAQGQTQLCSRVAFQSTTLPMRRVVASTSRSAATKSRNLVVKVSATTSSAAVATRPPSEKASLDKPTVLVAEKLGEAGIELLRKVANVDCSYNLSNEDLCSKIADCDALIVRSGTKVTREVFEASKGRLKVCRSLLFLSFFLSLFFLPWNLFVTSDLS
jgi:hypothetical protein